MRGVHRPSLSGRGVDRRTFLVAAAGGLVLHGCGRDRASGAPESTPDPQGEARGSALEAWGVQLYTLRDRLDDDLEGTLEAVAAIGYEEVELFQLHGLRPSELRLVLDRVGLRAASSHYPIEALRDDLERTIEGALTLGQRLMVVPSIPGDERDANGLARVAADLDRAGEAARAAGMRVGYHNHDWELRPLSDGTLPIDRLLDDTSPDLVDWQMDVFWTVHGGADPLAQLDRRRGRVASLHVKDRTASGQMVDVGDGVIDFAAVIRAAGGQGLLHAFVEHDTPGDSVDSVRRSLEHLRTLGIGPSANAASRMAAPRDERDGSPVSELA